MSLSISCSADYSIPLEVLQDVPWYDGFQKAIVTFGMGGNNTRGRFSGLPVYGHRDYSNIEVGETWYCALEPNDSKNYFAIPLLKIDASVLYSLSPEFRHDLADTIIHKFPDQAKALLKELTEHDNQQIDSSEHNNDNDRAESNGNDTLDDPTENEETKVPERSDTIYRSSPNRLTSDLFVEQRYNICLSRDRSTMMIQANESGWVSCCDNTIEIDYLDELMPSLERMTMRPKVSKNTGTIWVSIKQESPKVDHDDGGDGASASPYVL